MQRFGELDYPGLHASRQLLAEFRNSPGRDTVQGRREYPVAKSAEIRANGKIHILAIAEEMYTFSAVERRAGGHPVRVLDIGVNSADLNVVQAADLLLQDAKRE